MQTNSIYTATTNTTTTQKKSGDNAMGKDDFLRLLVTQMQNQDPLNPMDDKDFIAQTAQFTTLEQMQNLAQISQMQQTTSMIGKNVKAEVAQSDGAIPELIFGKVTSVRSTSDGFTLTLDNGTMIDTADIKSVMGDDGLLQEALSLKDQKVYVRQYNDEGKVSGLKQATIQDVKLDNGVLKLTTTDGATLQLKDIWNLVPEEADI